MNRTAFLLWRLPNNLPLQIIISSHVHKKLISLPQDPPPNHTNAFVHRYRQDKWAKPGDMLIKCCPFFFRNRSSLIPRMIFLTPIVFVILKLPNWIKSSADKRIMKEWTASHSVCIIMLIVWLEFGRNRTYVTEGSWKVVTPSAVIWST
jgi:hypothetical protein